LLPPRAVSPGCGPSPRVRGERRNGPANNAWAAGPSPRVRGERKPQLDTAIYCCGPSPRVRGEPAARLLPWPRRTGHPRVCGENQGGPCLDRMGSRAIPACAERTSVLAPAMMHDAGPSPRVRGELGCACAQSLTGSGHPRVCGENASPGAPAGAGSRAIPACAGRTAAMARISARIFGPSPRVRGERPAGKAVHRRWSGHPRVCGENGTATPRTRRLRSGHPRMCGENDQARLPPRGLQRAIPACAGRTCEGCADELIYRGPSPRVRGERLLVVPCCCIPNGPSPRVRGERQAAHCQHYRSQGHPRVCGENGQLHQPQERSGRAIPACAGRTPAVVVVEGRDVRAIPACAGRTAVIGLVAAVGERAIPACAGRTPCTPAGRP